MVCGIVENNRPYCPKCQSKEAETIKILDVDVVMIDEEPHFEFVVRCKKCDTRFYYFLDTEMAERKAVDKKSDRYSRIAKENTKDVVEEEFDD